MQHATFQNLAAVYLHVNLQFRCTREDKDLHKVSFFWGGTTGTAQEFSVLHSLLFLIVFQLTLLIGTLTSEGFLSQGLHHAILVQKHEFAQF